MLILFYFSRYACIFFWNLCCRSFGRLRGCYWPIGRTVANWWPKAWFLRMLHLPVVEFIAHRRQNLKQNRQAQSIGGGFFVVSGDLLTKPKQNGRQNDLCSAAGGNFSGNRKHFRRTQVSGSRQGVAAQADGFSAGETPRRQQASATTASIRWATICLSEQQSV